MQPQTKIEVDSTSNPACHAPVRRAVGHLIAFDIDGAIGATHVPLATASSLSDRGENWPARERVASPTVGSVSQEMNTRGGRNECSLWTLAGDGNPAVEVLACCARSAEASLRR
jgi:hypothetical protein